MGYVGNPGKRRSTSNSVGVNVGKEVGVGAGTEQGGRGRRIRLLGLHWRR